MSANLIVSNSPHFRKSESVSKIMWSVTLSLIPAGLAGVYIFGISALKVILLGVFSAVATEFLIQVIFKQKITVYDGSAFLTGLLLAYNLPAFVPFWLPIVGAVISIAIGKHVFGGLGQNIFNPALVGRVFLMASWPQYMTTFTKPFSYDGVTAATPLMKLKEGEALLVLNYLDLILGKRGGCIGEVCVVLLILGAIFLLVKKYISWHIPATYIGTTAVLTWCLGPDKLFTGDWVFHVLSGGLILGAFFMATDYVTSPLTAKGQIIFGIGCGLLTVVIRIWGGYPEGVSYAILIMNAATPIIDRYTKSRVYGTVKV
ncbi:MAG TPA: RnfABCDGE type electron transport complex subunit D [Candidatus Omnitrophota bacterium]|nr:RnfABCDGE type electron transport complex subunit D [Candidatus Omnitrophota bacterium]HQO58648.1 RnfABCDGE type electron transport complex subunit D [Candidatus Omnitrophota bacterium]HQP12519.1 RnfABCDGE type electron transport complex subunit D [Candidatus Omnitrophota bacterium]